MSTAEAARIAGLPPERVLRFDGNTPPAAPPFRITVRTAADDDALVDALADVLAVEP